jgi:hypothetical protein
MSGTDGPNHFTLRVILIVEALMPRYLPTTDFRARRKVLARSDFGIAPGPEPRPSDLVAKRVWESLVILPEDVAVRTSNHQGTTLAQLNELSSAWLFSTRMPPHRESMSPVMLDAHDEIEASIYNCLTGYYRFSIGGLRNVLELAAIGCWAEACGKKREFRDWRKGRIELGLGRACDGLISSASALESHLKATVNDTLFAQRDPAATSQTAKDGGWVRRSFSGLSNYSHSRPKYIDSHLRESNGPIYVESVFKHVAWMHFETIALAYVLALIARPKMRVSPKVRALFEDTDRVKSRVTRAAFEQLS